MFFLKGPIPSKLALILTRTTFGIFSHFVRHSSVSKILFMGSWSLCALAPSVVTQVFYFSLGNDCLVA